MTWSGIFHPRYLVHHFQGHASKRSAFSFAPLRPIGLYIIKQVVNGISPSTIIILSKIKVCFNFKSLKEMIASIAELLAQFNAVFCSAHKNTECDF